MYAGGPITWCSRKQSVVALSTTEAEYITAATCCKEMQFVKSILSELLDKDIEIKLKIDNQSAVKDYGLVSQNRK
jgi:KUP system potassium uptake protein